MWYEVFITTTGGFPQRIPPCACPWLLLTSVVSQLVEVVLVHALFAGTTSFATQSLSRSRLVQQVIALVRQRPQR